MIKTITASNHGGFDLPISWRDAVSAAAVRISPSMGGVSAVAAAGTKRRLADMAQVCTYTGTAVVLGEAFPGTSAWSPPI